MVKLTKPLASHAADGTLARTLVFGSAGGVHQARKHVTPKNPKSSKQTGVRAMMAFLSGSWSNLTQDQQASWQDLAASHGHTAFNSFVAHNLARWPHLESPIAQHPPAEIGEPAQFAALVATAHPEKIRVAWAFLDVRENWSVSIHRATAPAIEPRYDNCIAVIHSAVLGLQIYWDTLLNPGTYWYQILTYAERGPQAHPPFNPDATVT